MAKLNQLWISPLAAILFAVLMVSGIRAEENPERKICAAFRLEYDRVQDGVTLTGHGTAFGVNLSAYGFPGARMIITAAHNVIEAKQIINPVRVEVGEDWFGAHVVFADSARDIALLVANHDVPQLELELADPARLSTVHLLGAKHGTNEVREYAGTIEKKYYDGSARTLSKIEFDHGDSGGPFLNATGRVIGVAVAGLPKNGEMDHAYGLYMPTTAIAAFLEEYAETIKTLSAAGAKGGSRGE